MATGNVGLAFGLVIAAGLCTALGAALAFCAKLTDHRMLAGALGVSAGVMMYVSFVEIFTSKSIKGFRSAGFDEKESYRYATLTFFGGMLFTWILDQFCHAIMHLSEHGCCCGGRAAKAQPAVEQPRSPQGEPSPPPAPAAQQRAANEEDPEAPVPAAATAAAAAPKEQSMETRSSSGSPSTDSCCDGDVRLVLVPPPLTGQDDAFMQVLKGDHHKALTRMGLLSGLAVCIHNFPEGLATFVGTLADPRAGVAIAVAIAMHNIPEGIVVAMPIYFATGSKWKAFLWSTLSGVSEPIGALLGYLILKGGDSDPMMYAIMFAIVAGMMVYISLHALIPTALRFDPNNQFTTRGAIVGFMVMAASLLLFQA